MAVECTFHASVEFNRSLFVAARLMGRSIGPRLRSAQSGEQLNELALDPYGFGHDIVHQGVELFRMRPELAGVEMPGDSVACRRQAHRAHLGRRGHQLVGLELDAGRTAARAVPFEQIDEGLERRSEERQNFFENAVGAGGIEIADDRQRSDFERTADFALMPERVGCMKNRVAAGRRTVRR